jgi:hypothetical protein
MRMVMYFIFDDDEYIYISGWTEVFGTKRHWWRFKVFIFQFDSCTTFNSGDHGGATGRKPRALSVHLRWRQFRYITRGRGHKKNRPPLSEKEKNIHGKGVALNPPGGRGTHRLISHSILVSHGISRPPVLFCCNFKFGKRCIKKF